MGLVCGRAHMVFRYMVLASLAGQGRAAKGELIFVYLCVRWSTGGVRSSLGILGEQEETLVLGKCYHCSRALGISIQSGDQGLELRIRAKGTATPSRSSQV